MELKVVFEEDLGGHVCDAKQEAGQSTVAHHVNGPTLAFGRRHVDAKKAVIFENGPARSALQINLPVQPGIVPLIFVDHLAFLGGRGGRAWVNG